MDAHLFIAPGVDPLMRVAGLPLVDHAIANARRFGASRVVLVTEKGGFERDGIDDSVALAELLARPVSDTLVMSGTHAYDRRIDRAFIDAPFHSDDALRFVRGLDDTDAGLVRACGAGVPIVFGALCEQPMRWCEPSAVASEVAPVDLTDIVHLPRRLDGVAVVDASSAGRAARLLSDGVFSRLARLLRSR